jgi:hypothetical protein
VRVAVFVVSSLRSARIVARGLGWRFKPGSGELRRAIGLDPDFASEAGQEFVRFANAWKTVLFVGSDRARCKTFYALGRRTAKKLLLLRRANEFLPGLKRSIRATCWKPLFRSQSMISSARANTMRDTARPRVLAVLRLSAISYLLGVCTGRSPGAAPLRMRST